MNDKHDNPLRLQPPIRRSDPALGERLALLAQASTPTTVRRRAWRAPLAGLAIVVGTGGLAYGTQAVVHSHHVPSVVVPGSDLSLAPLPSSADDATDETAPASSPGVPDRSQAAITGGAHTGRGRSAEALTSAPGQVVRSEGHGASTPADQGRSDQAHGKPSSPGEPSTAAPGRGKHTKGTRPTTAASPVHPSGRPSTRPSNRPSNGPSLPTTAQGAG